MSLVLPSYGCLESPAPLPTVSKEKQICFDISHSSSIDIRCMCGRKERFERLSKLRRMNIFKIFFLFCVIRLFFFNIEKYKKISWRKAIRNLNSLKTVISYSTL